jgi:hypothetical protein
MCSIPFTNIKFPCRRREKGADARHPLLPIRGERLRCGRTPEQSDELAASIDRRRWRAASVERPVARYIAQESTRVSNGGRFVHDARRVGQAPIGRRVLAIRKRATRGPGRQSSNKVGRDGLNEGHDIETVWFRGGTLKFRIGLLRAALGLSSRRRNVTSRDAGGA